MKRADIVELIRYHAEHDDVSFNNKAASIAREFSDIGEHDLAAYIMSLISSTRTFIPQSDEDGSAFLRKVVTGDAPLPLPKPIANDIRGIINAIAHHMGVNKFLFQGPPGTGKTESAKQLARILRRELYTVDFNSVIDSKLGETAKNISFLFREVNAIGAQAVALFDEIDAVALDRINVNDVREMGRATSAILKELDALSDDAVLVATTNLYSRLDPALTRRFDVTVNFDCYTHEDLVDIGVSMMGELCKSCDFIKSDLRLLRRILQTAPELPFPGELKNLLKTSVAFSDPSDTSDYLVRIYSSLHGSAPDATKLSLEGFTMREMEVLTGISRSTISRTLREANDE